MTQVELARRAGTSQPTIAAYESATKSPNLRTLRRLAGAAGLDLVVLFVTPLTREDRRSLMLHHHIARRLRADPEGVLAIAKANADLMWKGQHGARPLLDEWRAILSRPTAQIVAAMTDPGVHARDLRQVTPFAGVLTTAERTRAYSRFRDIEAA